MNDELRGIPVLVHPELGDDPAQRQNEVGLVSYTDLANDDIFINFPDGGQGLYATDALLVFKPIGQIQGFLTEVGPHLAAPNLKALTQIELLLHYGSVEQHMVAMHLTQSNPAIQPWCLETLEHKIAMEQNQNVQR